MAVLHRAPAAPVEAALRGPDLFLFRHACLMGLEGLVSKRPPIAPAGPIPEASDV